MTSATKSNSKKRKSLDETTATTSSSLVPLLDEKRLQRQIRNALERDELSTMETEAMMMEDESGDCAGGDDELLAEFERRSGAMDRREKKRREDEHDEDTDSDDDDNGNGGSAAKGLCRPMDWDKPDEQSTLVKLAVAFDQTGAYPPELLAKLAEVQSRLRVKRLARRQARAERVKRPKTTKEDKDVEVKSENKDKDKDNNTSTSTNPNPNAGGSTVEITSDEGDLMQQLLMLQAKNKDWSLVTTVRLLDVDGDQAAPAVELLAERCVSGKLEELELGLLESMVSAYDDDSDEWDFKKLSVDCERLGRALLKLAGNNPKLSKLALYEPLNCMEGGVRFTPRDAGHLVRALADKKAFAALKMLKLRLDTTHQGSDESLLNGPTESDLQLMRQGLETVDIKGVEAE